MKQAQGRLESVWFSMYMFCIHRNGKKEKRLQKKISRVGDREEQTTNETGLFSFAGLVGHRSVLLRTSCSTLLGTHHEYANASLLSHQQSTIPMVFPQNMLSDLSQVVRCDWSALFCSFSGTVIGSFAALRNHHDVPEGQKRSGRRSRH